MTNQPKNTGIKELLKYPILVLSIILGIITLDYFEYNIVSFGTAGIEVEKRIANTLEGSEELSRKVDSLELLIAQLYVEQEVKKPEKTKSKKTQNSEQEETNEKSIIAGTPSVSKAQMSTYQLLASDLTTKFNKDLDDIKHSSSRIGWIWIGNYSNQGWDPGKLKKAGEKFSYSGSPDGIQKNEIFEVTGNMYMREYLPPDDEGYYRSVKSVGIVPNGSKVEVLEPPTGIDREFAVQYWMKVKYL